MSAAAGEMTIFAICLRLYEFIRSRLIRSDLNDIWIACAAPNNFPLIQYEEMIEYLPLIIKQTGKTKATFESIPNRTSDIIFCSVYKSFHIPIGISFELNQLQNKAYNNGIRIRSSSLTEN